MSADAGRPGAACIVSPCAARVDTDCWRVDSHAGVVARQWGDEVVVYLGERASTHLLSAAAGSAVLCLIDSDAALSVEALFANAFGDTAAAAMSPTERAALLDILVELEQLGIAVRVPGSSGPNRAHECDPAPVSGRSSSLGPAAR